jgi:hypothetical protein
MPWVKLDDRFPSHRKVALLSDRAFRLHVSAICWCAENLTDGRISDRELPLVAHIRGIKATAKQLEDAGVWDRIDDGWMIHDYLDYNPSREQVLLDRKKNAERQERFRRRKNGKPTPPPNGDGNASSNGVTPVGKSQHGDTTATGRRHDDDMSASSKYSVSGEESQVIELRNGVTNGAPTRPDPNPISMAGVGGESAGRVVHAAGPDGLHEIPDDFHLNDTMRRWVVALYPALDADFETEQFIRYWRSEGRRKRNWHDAWQKWIADSAKKARDRQQRNGAAAGGGRSGTGSRAETHTADDYTNSSVEDLFAS